MKTTVEISDALFGEAKKVAARKRIPMRQLIEEGLRVAIEQHRGVRARFRLKDGSFGGKEPVTEIAWPEVRSVIYEGRGE